MEMNARMRRFVEDTVDHDPEIPAELESIIKSGFIQHEDSWILRKLAENGPSESRDAFADATGFEVFINSLYINDYVQDNLLASAVVVGKRLLELWHSLPSDLPLFVFIIEDEGEIKIKAHAKRTGEAWLPVDSINDPAIEQGVLVMTSAST